ncbi:MAG: hypothetical protein NZ961_25420, partial [Candidatus Poribacteria bacterium]|nr:hypothetical protein [Candidatus Poribacteria bacterium]
QYNCQLKFVVETEQDLVEIQQLQQEMQIPSSIIVLMPQGISRDQIQAKQNWMVIVIRLGSTSIFGAIKGGFDNFS